MPTLKEYLQEGGEREDKLAVIAAVDPFRLSDDYRKVFELFESDNRNIRLKVQKAFPDLYLAAQRVEAIPQEDLPIASE